MISEKIKFNLHKKKFFLIFVIAVFFVSFIINSISAEPDVKAKIKYCELALSSQDVNQWKFQDASGVDESSVFKPWDSSSQEGIFMIINNTNRVLGEPANYNFIKYTEKKDWFNEYNSGDGTKSDIPVINVGPGKDKWFYMRCYYKVGNYRIFIQDAGYCNVGYVTDDFNLTKGIILGDVHKGEIPHISIFGSYLYHLHPKVFINNIVNLNENGFFPNSEPYIIYKGRKNIAQKPTGLDRVSAGWILREEGSRHVVSGFNTYSFYINNSNTDYSTEKWLKPNYVQTIRKDENTGETATGYTNTGVKVVPGHNYTVSNTYNNPYNVPITVNFFTRFGTQRGNYGIGRGGADIKKYNGPTTYKKISFSPFETKSVNLSSIAPGGDYVIYIAYGTFKIKSNSSYDIYNAVSGAWPVIGSDEYPYFEFLETDARITMETINGTETPIFKIVSRMGNYGAGNNKYNLDVSTSDYDILARVYENDLSNLVGEYTFNLENPIPKEQSITQEFTIPIKEEWQGNHGTNYYVKLFGKAKGLRAIARGWDGKTVTGMRTTPYFKPGALQYCGAPNCHRTFYFGQDKRTDSTEITIFNPTFYIKIINLSVISLSDNAFTIDVPKTIQVAPLSTKKIESKVTANYTSWPSTPQLDNFILRAETEGVEYTDIEYYLNVSEGDAPKCHTGDPQNPVIPIHTCYYNKTNKRLYYCYDAEYLKETTCELGAVCCPENRPSCREGFCVIPGTPNGCAGFFNWNDCNEIHLPEAFICGWNCSYNSCPPGNINHGDCESCLSFLPTCSAYNNNETCESDPCMKKEETCTIFNCDKSYPYYCFWNFTTKTCQFRTVKDNSYFCLYDIVISPEKCRPGVSERVISITSNQEGCPGKTMVIPCPTNVQVLFFSIEQFIIAVLLIIGIYIIRDYCLKE